MGSKSSPQPSGFTTTTQNNAPWAPQQPYLESALSSAQNLYNNYVPLYYPTATIAYPTDLQLQGIASIGNTASNLNNYLYPELGQLNSIGTGAYLNSGPGVPTLNMLTEDKTGLNLQGSDVLQQEASGANPAALNPGNQALADTAGGNYLAAGNPYSSGLAQSVLANVVPSIESQFINGGGLSGPQAAYATSQGATAALAPLMFGQYQQERQNQLGAAQNLAQNYLAGTGLQQGAATTLGAQNMAGLNLREQAAQALQNSYASDAQRMIQALALGPSTAQSLLAGPQAMYNIGATQQGLLQNEINDQVQRWNYMQQLPYQLLNEYIGQISGNYGGVSSTSQPFYTNPMGNALSGVLGGGLLGSQALGPAGLNLVSPGVGGGIGAGIGALLAFL